MGTFKTYNILAKLRQTFGRGSTEFAAKKKLLFNLHHNMLEVYLGQPPAGEGYSTQRQ